MPNATNSDARKRLQENAAAAAGAPAQNKALTLSDVVDVDTVLDLAHAKIELINEFKLDIDGDYYLREEPETYAALVDDVAELERLIDALLDLRQAGSAA